MNVYQKIMSKIIAAVNQKGGIGKTTLVLNIAYALSNQGKSVLIVDNDPQGHATSVLIPDETEINNFINDIYTNKSSAKDIIIKSEAFEVDCLTSNIYLADVEMQLINKFGRETHLKKAIQSLKYDYILIDCGPSLGMLTVNALVACDFYIIATRPERFALGGIDLVQRTVGMIKEELNPPLDLLGVCITWMPHTNIAKQHRQELVEYFKTKMFKTEIGQNKDVEEAHTYKKPVAKWNPKCRSARQYFELAEEVINR